MSLDPVDFQTLTDIKLELQESNILLTKLIEVQKDIRNSLTKVNIESKVTL